MMPHTTCGHPGCQRAVCVAAREKRSSSVSETSDPTVADNSAQVAERRQAGIEAIAREMHRRHVQDLQDEMAGHGRLVRFAMKSSLNSYGLTWDKCSTGKKAEIMEKAEAYVEVYEKATKGGSET